MLGRRTLGLSEEKRGGRGPGEAALCRKSVKQGPGTLRRECRSGAKVPGRKSGAGAWQPGSIRGAGVAPAGLLCLWSRNGAGTVECNRRPAGVHSRVDAIRRVTGQDSRGYVGVGSE